MDRAALRHPEHAVVEGYEAALAALVPLPLFNPRDLGGRSRTRATDFCAGKYTGPIIRILFNG